MKFCFVTAFVFCHLLGGAMAVENPSPTPSATQARPNQEAPARLIDELEPAQLDQILGEMRDKYIDSKALTSNELNQATIKGLLSKLGPGVRVQSKAEFERAKPVRPFRHDLVENKFGYIRLGTLKESSVKQLDSAIAEFQSRNIQGLILDLRTVSEDSDYDLANAVVSRFVSSGQPTFELIEKGDDEPKKFTAASAALYQGPLAILVDGESAGAAEAVAGVLKAKLRALIIGQTTAGRAVQYEPQTVGNLVVSIAKSKIQIAGLPSIFPQGLVPDIVANVSADLQNQILAQTDVGPLDSYINDEERPHLNEAALVNGTNPELDAYEEEQSGKSAALKPKDESFQHALDFLVTLDIYKDR